jgi:hypothetical protein
VNAATVHYYHASSSSFSKRVAQLLYQRIASVSSDNLADEKEEEKATVGCFWFSGDISVLHSQLTRSTNLRQRTVAEENELAGWLYWGGKESCPCKGKVHRDNEIT